VLCEIDGGVIEACKQHLADGIGEGVFSDPRIEIVCMDAVEYIRGRRQQVRSGQLARSSCVVPTAACLCVSTTSSLLVLLCCCAVVLLCCCAVVLLCCVSVCQYDVIIVDSSDPIGPAALLYTSEFYADMKAALRGSGIICTQVARPIHIYCQCTMIPTGPLWLLQ
jgi:predicted membrane-bound spermidine synthase